MCQLPSEVNAVVPRPQFSAYGGAEIMEGDMITIKVKDVEEFKQHQKDVLDRVRQKMVSKHCVDTTPSHKPSHWIKGMLDSLVPKSHNDLVKLILKAVNEHKVEGHKVKGILESHDVTKLSEIFDMDDVMTRNQIICDIQVRIDHLCKHGIDPGKTVAAVRVPEDTDHQLDAATHGHDMLPRTWNVTPHFRGKLENYLMQYSKAADWGNSLMIVNQDEIQTTVPSSVKVISKTNGDGTTRTHFIEAETVRNHMDDVVEILIQDSRYWMYEDDLSGIYRTERDNKTEPKDRDKDLMRSDLMNVFPHEDDGATTIIDDVRITEDVLRGVKDATTRGVTLEPCIEQAAVMLCRNAGLEPYERVKYPPKPHLGMSRWCLRVAEAREQRVGLVIDGVEITDEVMAQGGEAFSGNVSPAVKRLARNLCGDLDPDESVSDEAGIFLRAPRWCLRVVEARQRLDATRVRRDEDGLFDRPFNARNSGLFSGRYDDAPDEARIPRPVREHPSSD